MIVDINPLKPGKLEAYKAFVAIITGPRKKEFSDLLKRYGLKTAEVFYQKLGDREFVIVIHQAEDDALDRLSHFESSKNPYDIWFSQQLKTLHDFTGITNPHSELLFSFNAES